VGFAVRRISILEGGLITPEVYAPGWTSGRRRKANDSLQAVTYQQAWPNKIIFLDHEPDSIAYYKEFTDFMEGVFQGKLRLMQRGPEVGAAAP